MNKETVSKTILMILLGFIFSIALCTIPANAQENDWVEIKTIEIPQGLEIFSGITRNGNPKYWFEIEGMKIFISPVNKEHYINNTCVILLVEWYNKNKNCYRYTTRQKKETKKSKRLNLSKYEEPIFYN